MKVSNADVVVSVSPETAADEGGGWGRVGSGTQCSCYADGAPGPLLLMGSSTYEELTSISLQLKWVRPPQELVLRCHRR